MASTNFVNGTVVQPEWLDDVDTATYSTLTTVVGTNAITATGPASMTAYAAGQKFSFLPTAANTGATTININGLGVQPVTKNGSTNLAASDLAIGKIAFIVYDGSLFQLVNPQTVPVGSITGVLPIANGGTGASTASAALVNLGAVGRLLGVQFFNASGTYTPTPGTTRVLVRVQAGGGAGGGCPATAAGQLSMGAGGGAGGYSEGIITTGFTPNAPVTVGTGGGGVSGTTGGAGGTSSFLTISATGGGGGGASTAAPTVVASPGVGGSGSGGSLNVVGARGVLCGANTVAVLFISGAGAASPYGGGGVAAQTTAGSVAGSAAAGFGSGGSGAVAAASSSAQAGGAGTAGFVLIYEYS